MDFFARELMRFGGMVNLGWQRGGIGVRIGGSVVRRHEVGHDVDGNREDHLDVIIIIRLYDGDIGKYGEELWSW